MKLKFSAVLAITYLLIPSQALASGFTNYGKIKIIHQRECSTDKGFEVEFYEDHSNPDNCSNSRIIDVSCNHPAHNTIVSISMVAFTTNKKISYWVSSCENGQAKATTARIHQASE